MTYSLTNQFMLYKLLVDIWTGEREREREREREMDRLTD